MRNLPHVSASHRAMGDDDDIFGEGPVQDIAPVGDGEVVPYASQDGDFSFVSCEAVKDDERDSCGTVDWIRAKAYGIATKLNKDGDITSWKVVAKTATVLKEKRPVAYCYCKLHDDCKHKTRWHVDENFRLVKYVKGIHSGAARVVRGATKESRVASAMFADNHSPNKAYKEMAGAGYTEEHMLPKAKMKNTRQTLQKKKAAGSAAGGSGIGSCRKGDAVGIWRQFVAERMFPAMVQFSAFQYFFLPHFLSDDPGNSAFACIFASEFMTSVFHSIDSKIDQVSLALDGTWKICRNQLCVLGMSIILHHLVDGRWAATAFPLVFGVCFSECREAYEALIDAFIKFYNFDPNRVRSVCMDGTQAGYNACSKYFTRAIIFSCLQHIREGIQRNKGKCKNSELWKLIRAWVDFTAFIPSKAQFSRVWGHLLLRLVQDFGEPEMAKYVSDYVVTMQENGRIDARWHGGFLFPLDDRVKPGRTIWMCQCQESRWKREKKQLPEKYYAKDVGEVLGHLEKGNRGLFYADQVVQQEKVHPRFHDMFVDTPRVPGAMYLSGDGIVTGRFFEKCDMTHPDGMAERRPTVASYVSKGPDNVISMDSAHQGIARYHLVPRFDPKLKPVAEDIDIAVKLYVSRSSSDVDEQWRRAGVLGEDGAFGYKKLWQFYHKWSLVIELVNGRPEEKFVCTSPCGMGSEAQCEHTLLMRYTDGDSDVNPKYFGNSPKSKKVATLPGKAALLTVAAVEAGNAKKRVKLMNGKAKAASLMMMSPGKGSTVVELSDDAKLAQSIKEALEKESYGEVMWGLHELYRNKESIPKQLFAAAGLGTQVRKLGKSKQKPVSRLAIALEKFFRERFIGAASSSVARKLKF